MNGVVNQPLNQSINQSSAPADISLVSLGVEHHLCPASKATCMLRAMQQSACDVSQKPAKQVQGQFEGRIRMPMTTVQ
eukprot:COSAG06_NODE_31447_length_521_cov_1.334123_1_plen_78_part_00